MIGDIKQQNDHLAQTQFTENFTVNTILQDAAYRAAQSDIRFEALVSVPPQLTVAESDLCELLMNMLDNALEAAAEADAENGLSDFRLKQRTAFLPSSVKIRIPASAGRMRTATISRPRTMQRRTASGLKLMSAVAVRYHSMLDIFTSENQTFTVQTALKLPKK